MDNLFEIRPGRRIYRIIDESTVHDPTIFLIHGFAGSGEQWRNLVPFLKNRYRLVIPDLLGHGLSEKPRPTKDNPYTFTEYSQDLQSLFEKHASPHNIIIGHSYGGALAANLAAYNQTAVNKLILIAPMSCKPVMTVPPIFRLPAWLLELLRPYLEKNFRETAFVATDSPALLSEEDRAGKKNAFYVLKALLQGTKDIPWLDVTKIHIPTLVICGEHDGIMSMEKIRSFYGALPDVQFETLTNAAHMLMLEQPEKVDALIEKFLNKYK
jgi:pimeloyl-ACP methyl ester carboxylesterase